MSANAWTAIVGEDFALVADTAATALSIIPVANKFATITEISFSLDGLTSTAEPVLVEMCISTEAGSPVSTAAVVTQIRGKSGLDAPFTARKKYTTENTVLTAVKEWRWHPQSGVFLLQNPLGREIAGEDTDYKAIHFRVTAAAAVNIRGYLEVE